MNSPETSSSPGVSFNLINCQTEPGTIQDVEMILRASNARKSDFWKPETTRLFLDLYKKYRSLFLKHSAISVYTLISQKISELSGVDKKPQECQKKYYNLVRTYKASGTRTNTVKFPYFQEMNEILNVKSEMFVDQEAEKEFREVYKYQGVKKSPTPKKEVVKVVNAEELPEIVDKKDIWSIKETDILIDLYKKYKDSLGKNKAAWNLISVELQNIGFHKEPRKCMKKVFNLRRTYKNIIMKGKEGTARFPFVKKLSEIFGKSMEIKEEYGDEDISYVYSDDDLNEWTDNEIKALINAYGHVKSLYSYSYDQPEFWETVSALLSDSGMDRNSVECDHEFQDLVGAFEKSKINGNSSSFSYFEDFEKLFAHTEETFLNIEILPDISIDHDQIDIKEQYVNAIEDTIHSKDKITTIWKQSQTLNLISLYYQHKDIIENEAEKWFLISEQLQKSPEDCQLKWKSLMDSGRSVFKGILDEVHAPYYGTLIEYFGETLFKEEKEKVKVGTLSEEQVNELIELKHFYSKTHNSMKLPTETWQQIADNMNLDIDPKILEKNYYDMFKKYMYLKEENPDDNEKNVKEWNLFGVIEESLDTEKVKETELEQNAKIVSKNFHQICKICLNLKETSLIVVQPDTELVEKVKYLMDKPEDFDAEMLNLICPACEKNLDDFWEFKKQFGESLEILSAVRNKYGKMLETRKIEIKEDHDYESYGNKTPLVIDMNRLKRVLFDKKNDGESPSKRICKESSSDIEI